jgi:iron complex transport system substrate-binding protein
MTSSTTTPRLLTALVGAAALALAACGGTTTAGPDASAPASTGPSDEAAAPADAAAFPVSIEHVHGTTTIDAAPERVVSIGFSDQDTILALGVTPVGIRDWYGDQPNAVWPWATDELGDAEPTVLSSAELDFEAVAALEPDLIVGLSSGMTASDYELLSQIAPTLAQSGDHPDFGMPWQEQTLAVGQALGRSEQAEQVVADTEDLFAQAREAHPEFEGASATVGFVFDGQPGAYASTDSRSRLLGDLGFTVPSEIDELAGDAFFVSVSPEEVTTLDADALVWIVGSDAEVDAIASLPTRGSLVAAQEGREVLTDFELSGAFSFSSPLSIPFVLEQLVPELALAVDGDPTTEVPSAAVLAR